MRTSAPTSHRHAGTRQRRDRPIAALGLLSGLMLRIARVLAPNPSIYTLEGTNTWIVGSEPSTRDRSGPGSPSIWTDVGPARAEPSGRLLVTHDHPDHAPGAVAFAQQVGAPPLRFPTWPARRNSAPDSECAPAPRSHGDPHARTHLGPCGVLRPRQRRAVLRGCGEWAVAPPSSIRRTEISSSTCDRSSAWRISGREPSIRATGRSSLRAQREDPSGTSRIVRRERQEVLIALAEGPRTIAEMVEVIYADHPKDVHPLAARSVLAHLLKLADEGRADRTGKTDEGPWTASTPRTCQRCGRDRQGQGALLQLMFSCDAAVRGVEAFRRRGLPDESVPPAGPLHAPRRRELGECSIHTLPGGARQSRQMFLRDGQLQTTTSRDGTPEPIGEVLEP